jgi:4-hydroxy-2-oxoheptanedioate aldolase
MTPMKGFSLASLLRSGETVYTAWCSLASPQIVEIAAREGFKAVSIDGQHGLWEPETMRNGVAAIRQGGGAPIVRIGIEEFGMASRALDWGAEGIVAPMINNVTDAKRFAGACKFPPIGERSWGPHRSVMLAGVTDLKTFLRDANDNIVTIAMIETQEAMDNVDAIAAVPGIDVLFVGPSDLSITLTKGAELDPHSKIVEAANDKVLAACKKAGKFAGLYCATAERAVEVSKRGFRFCAVGNDLGFIRAAYANAAKVTRGG